TESSRLIQSNGL
ncbi:hypothetical protein NPIL_678251, partial [Nephila pilipes]